MFVWILFFLGGTNRVAELFYEEEVFLGWNPLSHASGFILPMMALCCGAKVVPSRGGLSANEFVEVVHEHQVKYPLAHLTIGRYLSECSNCCVML